MSTDLPSGVKATTGDRFNRDEPFKFFIASNPGASLAVPNESILIAVNELDTRKNMDNFERLLDEGRDILLDSGIFNLAMDHVRDHGTTHDYALNLAPEEIDGFEELWDTYARIVTEYGSRLWGVVELDQGGFEHKPRTRKRIEDELGVVPIPVYHPFGDGWDYYDTLAQNYDRICFGNMVQASPQVRVRLMYTAYRRAMKYPYLWTHILGLTPNQTFQGTRMRGSSDSSSWLSPLRWMPSWKGWAMTRMITNYPPSMWNHAGTDGDYERERLVSLCANVAMAIPIVMEGMRHDTHPALTIERELPHEY